MEAFYLAQAIANYVLCYSPQKIVEGTEKPTALNFKF